MKGKSLFYENWIKSGLLYVKDFLDEEGNIDDLRSFDKILKNKSNWLCEYKAISSKLKPFVKKKDYPNIKYKNTKPDSKFVFTLDMMKSLGRRATFSIRI